MEKARVFIPNTTALKFKEILKSLINQSYNDILKQEKEICSFGVFTDSDISGFVVYYNVNCEKETDKWWMPEWYLASMNEEIYKQLELIMDNLGESSTWDIDDEKNTFAIYKNEIFDLICQALKELKEEKLFLNVSKDFFLLVQESDNGVYETRAKSLQQIMSSEQFEAYQKSEEY